MDVQNNHQFKRLFKTMDKDSRMQSRGMTVSDSRYRNIVGQLDAMFEQLLHKPDKDLGADIDRLLDTMMEHIDNENGYMRMVAFPQAVQHGLHHQFICTKTAELHYRISKGQEITPEALSDVRLLWMEHIHVHDRAFEVFLAC